MRDIFLFNYDIYQIQKIIEGQKSFPCFMLIASLL